MREIKFRAFDKIGCMFLRLPFYIGCEGYTYKDSDPYGVDMSGKRKIYPIELIINQYTGLKDKNGKEIYEGDIISRLRHEIEGDWASDLYHDLDYSHTVVFKFGSFVSDVTHETIYKIITPMNITESTQWEVIGNIYENPELLTDKL